MSKQSLNPERDAEILRRWDKRESSGAIARALGVSRSTISGVVHRAEKQRGEPNNTEAKREAARQAGKILWARRRAGNAGPKPNRTVTMRAIKSRQREQAAQAYAIEAEASPPEPAPIAQRCTILDLTDSKCHWPIGDPGQPDFFFCGGKTLNGVPYCGYHTRVAYRPKGVQ